MVPEQTAEEKEELAELVKADQDSGRIAIVRQLQAWWPVATPAERADYYKTNKPK
jgi:hypothetical protein